MILISPIDVPPLPTDDADAVLIDTNIPATATGEAEWNSGTSYVAGNIVSVLGSIQRRYESLTSNSNKSPPDNPSDWLDLGSTNRWKMFDQGTLTLTRQAETIDVTLAAKGLVNSIAMFNVSAASIQIIVTAAGATTPSYDKTFDFLVGLSESNWWYYFYETTLIADTPEQDSVVLDMPQLIDPTEQIIITRGDSGETDPNEQPSIGELIVGKQQKLGASLFGSSVGIRDYSKKEADVFGNFQVIERRFSKYGDFDVVVETQKVSEVQKALASRRATPTVYLGSERACLSCQPNINSETLIYGYYRDFSVVLSNRNTSMLSIDVEGL